MAGGARPDGGDPGGSGSDGGSGVPRILLRAPGAADGTVAQVERGIEEEGVPWAVRSEGSESPREGSDSPRDGVALAHEAATASSLKIGVSVIDDRVVVHHGRLPADDPLFDESEVSAALARRLGSNAARLAKGTPLKPVD